MSDIQVVSGIRRTIKERVDGSLIVQIEIDMRFKTDFLRMFPDIDMPVAIAPLKADFEAEKPQESTKISGLTLLAVEWCKEPRFWKWINELKTINYFDKPFIATSELEAKFFVQSVCEISSRKEINTNPQAAAIFQQEIRGPYMQWCQENFPK